MSFVDTNVLVHATAIDEPFGLQARAALARLRARGPVAVSRQILREYLASVTRPQAWAAPRPMADAFADIRTFESRFTIVEDSAEVFDELQKLSRQFSFGGRQVHDANIVATMIAHGETRLLTFNAADFRRFDRLIEVVPP